MSGQEGIDGYKCAGITSSSLVLVLQERVPLSILVTLRRETQFPCSKICAAVNTGVFVIKKIGSGRAEVSCTFKHADEAPDTPA